MERLWTLDRMAQYMGISLSQVAKIEKGQARPTPLTLAKISRALALPMTDLIVPASRPQMPTVPTYRTRGGGLKGRRSRPPGSDATPRRRQGRPVSAPPKVESQSQEDDTHAQSHRRG